MKSKVTKVTPKKKAVKPKAVNDWPDRFILALSEWPNVTLAARKAQVSRTEVYRTRNENPEFEKKFDEARKLGWLAYEDKAIDREDSAALTIFMLKNKLGYSDRNVVEQINLDVSQLNDEQLAKLAKGDDIRSIIAASGASRIRATPANQDAADNA